ncbi:OLC1v1021532C9 [Oldenlandia corymbosa var. corymbosa]|uniref:OLC1v1021532C9 n=1 Tax=Oldenlandia corymbosa var. corymbosa TaxID=529605 RepID=A0AAV1BVV7_OLDCO|nr:OLC1v1021532C9 [Oldenlandia corymbosa var. corymbosa]
MTEATGSEERFEETMAMEPKEVNEEEEEDEDEDGPPPGFDCIALQTETPKLIAEQIMVDKMEEELDEEDEGEEDDDVDGPPPGWSPIPPARQPNHHTSDVEMSEKQEALEDDDEDDGPPPGWDLVPPTSQGADAVPSDREIGSHQEGARDNNERTKQGHEIVPPSPMLPSTTCSLKAQASLPQEKGQMICGSCRKLLTYPRGVKYVRCSCCQTVNLVLEAHQVGQVKCGGCAVLLMYPEGAPSVKCCSCRYVTDIGAHNRRPPLSVQQARRLPFLNPVR